MVDLISDCRKTSCQKAGGFCIGMRDPAHPQNNVLHYSAYYVIIIEVNMY